MKFPHLFEIGKTLAVSTTGLATSLSREQREAQDQISDQFGNGCPRPQGVIYPWSTREARAVTATGVDQGGSLVGNDVIDIAPALRMRLTLEKLGARIYGGLRGDARFPSAGSKINAEWKSENAAASDGTFTFRGLSLAPKRVTAYLDVSWRLLEQGVAIENYLRSELFGALAEECQRVAIAGSGADNQPLGILNTPGIGNFAGGSDGAAPTHDGLTQLEYLVGQGSERDSTGWLLSPLVRRKLRRTPIFEGGSHPIWAQNESRTLLGHACGVTKATPDNLSKGASSEICSAIIHGEFSELIAGFWGPGIVVDAVSLGGHINGKTRFVAHAFFDSGVRAPEAFAAQKDALCLA
jgi:HK97 family phage major capsid protein